MVVAYGAVGAKPRGSTKTLDTAAAATAEMTKMINAKKNKGYVLTGETSATVASNTRPVPPTPCCFGLQR